MRKNGYARGISIFSKQTIIWKIGGGVHEEF